MFVSVSSLEWVEVREVWRWDSSVAVCSLCLWRHVVRLFTNGLICVFIVVLRAY